MNRGMILAALVTLAAGVPAALSAQVTVEAEIAEAIVDMMPQNPRHRLRRRGGRGRVLDAGDGRRRSEIRHIWIHGELEFPVTLPVNGSPWRTWSRKTIPPEWAGEWRVEIRDAQGNLLDTRSFTVGG